MKLQMANFKYKHLLEDLSDDRLKALALLMREREEKIKEEPLYKHKMNNDAQQALRDMDCD